MTDEERQMLAEKLKSKTLGMDQKILLAGMALLKKDLGDELKRTVKFGESGSKVSELKTSIIRVDELAIEIASWKSNA